MAHVFEDAYGHRSVAAAPALTAGAVGTSAVGTIAPIAAGAGATATVTFATGQTSNDTRGSFTLNPVGTPAAGPQALVTFTNTYNTAPACVLVTVTNTTSANTPTALAGYASTITASGFSVNTAITTTANNYTVTYQVIP